MALSRTMAHTDEAIIAAAKAEYAAANQSDEDIIAQARAEYKAAPREYEAEDYVHDIDKSVEQGGRRTAETILDVASLPLTLGMRNMEGLLDLEAGPEEGQEGGIWEGLKRFGRGFMESPEIGGQEIGDITHETAFDAGNIWDSPDTRLERMADPDRATTVDPSAEMRIPPEDTPDWLRRTKTAAELVTEFGLTAPLAGPKNLTNAAKAAVGGTLGGVAGEDLAGEEGKMWGAIAGSLAADPQGVLELLKGAGNVLTMPIKAIRAFMVKTEPSMANASDAELRAGWDYATQNIHPKDPNISGEDYLVELRNKLETNTDPGTTGQILEDPGLLNMERKYADEKGARDIDIQNALIEEQALAPMADIATTGRAADAAKEPRNFVQTLKAQNEANAAKLEDAALATEAETIVPFRNKSTAAEGATMQKSVAQQRAASEVKNEELWAEVGNPTMSAKSIKSSVDDVFKGMKPYTRNEIKRQMGDSWGAVKRMWDEVDEDGNIIGEIDFEGMNAAISGLSQASKDMPGAAKQVVGDLIDALYDSLGGPAGTARREAADAYRLHMEKFGPRSTTGKLLEAEPETFGKKLIGGGDEGLAKTREVRDATGDSAPVGPTLPNAKIAAQQDDVIRGAFNQLKVNKETGRVKPESINQFMTQYGDQMSPTLRKEILAAQKAGRDTGDVNLVAKQLRKDAADADQSTVGKFANTDDETIDVITRFDEVMQKGGKRSERLAELMAAASSHSDPKIAAQAMEDLRRAGIERLQSHVTDSGTGLTVKATEQFLNDRKALEASGLYSKWELDQIQDGLKTGEKKFLHDKAKKMPKVVARENLVFNTIFALGGAKAGAYAFGSPLIGAAIGRRVATKMAKMISTDQAEALAFEMSANPEVFLKMLNKFEGKKPTAEQIGNIVDEMILRGGLGTTVGVE